MSNGLLNGLTEAWEPDATLALIGKKTGLNTSADPESAYAVQSGFPTGHCLHYVAGTASTPPTTPSSALLQAIGQTDFMVIAWVLHVAGLGFNGNIGEYGSSANGVDWQGGNTPGVLSCEIPGADNGYSCSFNSSPDTPFTVNVAHMQAIWYTTADNTLHTSLDGGTVYSLVNSSGIGAQDATNYLSLNSYGQFDRGPIYLWQGTDAVANAIAQLSSLYTNKLQYSDFDSGGPPVPPVCAITGATEYGAGTATGVLNNTGQVIVGPFQTIDRDEMEIAVNVRATQAFHLNYEFSTDKGTTWYVGQQADSAAVSSDDGGAYGNQANIHFDVGYWWRISVFNASGSTMDVAFEWRFHSF